MSFSDIGKFRINFSLMLAKACLRSVGHLEASAFLSHEIRQGGRKDIQLFRGKYSHSFHAPKSFQRLLIYATTCVTSQQAAESENPAPR